MKNYNTFEMLLIKKKSSSLQNNLNLTSILLQSYLEANRMKKFVDIDDMAQTLYDDHDEYRSKKFKVRQAGVYIFPKNHILSPPPLLSK